MLQIVEILRPAEQGRTTPFLCRAEDERLYYVKGLNTGRQGQWCEWLAGHLGQAFGLPIPPFCLVELSAELLVNTCPEWRSIGTGPAFASLARQDSQWLESHFAGEVPVELRRDVLVFDWWIRNMDRFDDNTNLLWNRAIRQLTVIDHDLAFNPEFWPSLFRETPCIFPRTNWLPHHVHQHRRRARPAAAAGVPARRHWTRLVIGSKEIQGCGLSAIRPTLVLLLHAMSGPVWQEASLCCS